MNHTKVLIPISWWVLRIAFFRNINLIFFAKNHSLRTKVAPSCRSWYIGWLPTCWFSLITRSVNMCTIVGPIFDEKTCSNFYTCLSNVGEPNYIMFYFWRWIINHWFYSKKVNKLEWHSNKITIYKSNKSFLEKNGFEILKTKRTGTTFAHLISN